MKEKKKEAEGDLQPWEGALEEEMFLHPGKPPHWWGDWLGQKGSFKHLEERAPTSLLQAEHTETCTDGPYNHPALPSLRCASTGSHGTWVMKLGFRGQSQGED